jgi:hypothetical protein
MNPGEPTTQVVEGRRDSYRPWLPGILSGPLFLYFRLTIEP